MSYITNIKLNNLQTEVNQLKQAVEDLATGGQIFDGDIDMQNHNIQNCNNISVNEILFNEDENATLSLSSGGILEQNGREFIQQNSNINMGGYTLSGVIINQCGSIQTSQLQFRNTDGSANPTIMSDNGTTGLKYGVDDVILSSNLNNQELSLTNDLEMNNNNVLNVGALSCQEISIGASNPFILSNDSQSHPIININGLYYDLISTKNINQYAPFEQNITASTPYYLNSDIDAGAHNLLGLGDLSCNQLGFGNNYVSANPTTNELLFNNDVVVTADNIAQYIESSGVNWSSTAESNLNMNNYDITNCKSIEINNEVITYDTDRANLKLGNNKIVIREPSTYPSNTTFPAQNLAQPMQNLPLFTSLIPVPFVQFNDAQSYNLTITTSAPIPNFNASELMVYYYDNATSQYISYFGDGAQAIIINPSASCVGLNSVDFLNLTWSNDSIISDVNLSSFNAINAPMPIKQQLWIQFKIYPNNAQQLPACTLNGHLNITMSNSYGDIDLGKTGGLIMDSNTLQTDGTDLLWNSDKLLTNDGTAYNEMISSNIVNNGYSLSNNNIIPIKTYLTGSIANGEISIALPPLGALNTTMFINGYLLLKGATFKLELCFIQNSSINDGNPQITLKNIQEMYNEGGYVASIDILPLSSDVDSNIYITGTLNTQTDNYICSIEILKIDNT